MPPMSLLARRGELRWRTLGTEGGHTQLSSAGFRAEADDTTVTWASDVFADEIVFGAHARRGWVFVTHDGTVAASDTFTGTLRALGSVPAPTRGVESFGLAAFVDNHGALWTTDGVSPLSKREWPDGLVIEAGFSDDLHGAALLEGGGVSFTDDGGNHWRDVGLPHEIGVSLEVEPDALRVHTTTKTFVLAPNGTVAPYDPGLVAYGANGATREQIALTERLETALPQSHPAWMDRSWRTIEAGDGTALFRTGTKLTLLDRATGALVRALPHDLPNESCRLQPWGASFGATCWNREGAGIYRWDDAKGFTIVAPVTQDLMNDLVFSDDGRFVASLAPCESPSPGQSKIIVARTQTITEQACVIDTSTGSRHEVSLGAPAAELFALHGASMLVRYASMMRPATPYGVVHGDDAKVEPLTLPARVGDDAITKVSLRFAADGLVVGVADVGGDMPVPPVVISGTPGTGLATHAAPPGALGAGLVNATLGYAAGKSLAQLWETRDGGQNWSPIHIPVMGAPESIEFPVFENGRVSVMCNDTHCTIGGLLRLGGAGTFHTSPGAFVVRDVRQEPPGSPFGQFGVPFGAFSCKESGSASTAHRAAGPRFTGQGFQVTIEEPFRRLFGQFAREGTHTRARVVWDGEDTRGPFRGISTPTALTLHTPELDDPDAPDASYFLYGMTRSGAIIERCPDSGFSPSCETLFASDRGPVKVLCSQASDDDALSRCLLSAAEPLSDGGFALAFRWTEGYHTVMRLVRVSRSGTITSERSVTLVGDDGAVFLLATRGNLPGLFAERPGHAPRFIPVAPGQSPVELPALPSARPGVCREPAGPDTVSVWFAPTSGERTFVTPSPESADLWGMFEHGPRGTCLREIRYVETNPASTVRLTAVQDGTMMGTMETSDSSVPVVCTAASP